MNNHDDTTTRRPSFSVVAVVHVVVNRQENPIHRPPHPTVDQSASEVSATAL